MPQIRVFNLESELLTIYLYNTGHIQHIDIHYKQLIIKKPWEGADEALILLIYLLRIYFFNFLTF